ncbi:Hypothetical_protein [Hexamita inflata]|uniref:Hypothetical_protein n=1 Tax=Hexamita inflata TaxID=28002 RepID=A0ABP1HQG6_9EUKA
MDCYYHRLIFIKAQNGFDSHLTFHRWTRDNTVNTRSCGNVRSDTSSSWFQGNIATPVLQERSQNRFQIYFKMNPRTTSSTYGKYLSTSESMKPTDPKTTQPSDKKDPTQKGQKK